MYRNYLKDEQRNRRELSSSPEKYRYFYSGPINAN